MLQSAEATKFCGTQGSGREEDDVLSQRPSTICSCWDTSGFQWYNSYLLGRLYFHSCPFVCWLDCKIDYAKLIARITMKLGGRMCYVSGKNPLNSADPDQGAWTGISSLFLLIDFSVQIVHNLVQIQMSRCHGDIAFRKKIEHTLVPNCIIFSRRNYLKENTYKYKNNISIYLYVLYKYAWHTHMDDRAVAGHTGAVVILGSHYNSVLLPTVQVVPRARGGVGDTLVVIVAIKASCYGNIWFCTIAGSPADRAHVRLTLSVGGHILGDTWSCGERRVINIHTHTHATIKH